MAARSYWRTEEPVFKAHASVLDDVVIDVDVVAFTLHPVVCTQVVI